MIIINRKKVKGFIFDLDGVITDTAEYHYQSWKKISEEENIPFTREDNEQLRGLSRHDSLENFLGERELSEKQKQEWTARKNNYYQEYIEQITRNDLIPGVIDLLRELEIKKYKIAIASSSKNAKYVIKSLGIEDKFITVSDGNSVKQTKPAPDIFLYTADKMGLGPEECVVIEDSGSGVEAANSAGMISVGVGPERRVGKADYCYEHVVEINLKNFIKYFS